MTVASVSVNRVCKKQRRLLKIIDKKEIQMYIEKMDSIQVPEHCVLMPSDAKILFDQPGIPLPSWKQKN